MGAELMLCGSTIFQTALKSFEFPGVVFQCDRFRSTLNYYVSLFRETGSIGKKEDCGKPKIRTNEAVENIRNLIEGPPWTSVRVLIQQTEMLNNFKKGFTYACISANFCA
ncbi:hypothetical protein BDFB_003162 [Asbolus verrucosus]|uniref:Uncharacterized protein n=1 Tax=Asbolus verrucosus TaxID=1661398 RepID=A0A482VHS0_ASBVE|nr:hypothetical protein BDFB_003162 [Asbolus verrucosus]